MHLAGWRKRVNPTRLRGNDQQQTRFVDSTASRRRPTRPLKRSISVKRIHSTDKGNTTRGNRIPFRRTSGNVAVLHMLGRAWSGGLRLSTGRSGRSNVYHSDRCDLELDELRTCRGQPPRSCRTRMRYGGAGGCFGASSRRPRAILERTVSRP
jgi:hypothetical protein